jgi:hypothetical protein
MQNILEDIIKTCMRDELVDDGSDAGEYHTWNGGYWSWGNEYAEGWFYYTGGKSKRDLEIPTANTTVERTVYLAMDGHGNITGIEHDFQRQDDGTYEDVAGKRQG